VPTVLLTHEHDERSAVRARGGERTDRVAEARRRVEEHERWPPCRERLAGGDADHRALVQPEHERERLGETGQQRDLGRAGVGVHPREAVRGEHL
jgi:hypothetical protein